MIKIEKIKEYRSLVRANYNWFKHADKDTERLYSGPPVEQISVVNELQTMANMHSIATIKSEGFDFTSASYLGYMMNCHGDLFDIDEFLQIFPSVRQGFEYIKVKSPQELRADLRAAMRHCGLAAS